MIDPNLVPFRAPAIASGASCFAMLRHHPNVCPLRFHAAGVPSHVAGVARNHLRITVSVVAAVAVVIAAVTIYYAPILEGGRLAHGEIRAASMVHPNAPVIGAPAVAFGASGFAVLR